MDSIPYWKIQQARLDMKRFGLLIMLCLFQPNLLAQSTLEGEDSVFTNHFSERVYHPYVWLEDVGSENAQVWLQRQEDFKFDHFNKSDFKKLNYKLSFSSKSYEDETDRYSAKLSLYGKLPPVLTIKPRFSYEAPKPLIKCNTLKHHKYDFPFIEEYWISDEKNILVAAVSHSGSDWLELLVYDLLKPDEYYTLTGVIKPWILFHDDGFYYERYDVPSNETSIRKNQRLNFHKLGTSQDQDKLIFQNRDNATIRTFDFTKPKNSHWLYISHPFKLENQWREAISIVDVEAPLSPKTILVYNSPVRLTFDYIFEESDTAYFRTNMNKPTFEVLKVSLNSVNDYQTLVPAYTEVLLDATYLGSNNFGLKYLDHGNYFGLIYNKKKKSNFKISTPAGTSINFYRGESPKFAYFDFATFQFHPQTYLIDMSDMSTSKFSGRKLVSDDTFEVETKEYTNKDGDKIPVYIVYASNKIKKDGKNPTIIRVYGGYGRILEPRFHWDDHFFIKNGGVLVVPGVRGSGSLGTDWALKGRGAEKQNTIDDIIACAEYVTKEEFTNPDLVFLEGGSHGAFAVTAAAIQRPELFKGVMASAGVYDLVRVVDQTVGHAELNRIEFGDPSDSLAFKSRLSLSPIHNLEKGIDYPSFLLFTGSNDTRVAANNSYRFLAALQGHSVNNLNFLHVTNGGHDVATYPNEMLEIMSFKLKFLSLHTGVKYWK